ncbi:GntR family transcriptional regulator [Alloiococcus sp. CFN-8]|uniref:GntR family transcriptional regulator n=1 Tax=Alloiococcus sp. CFN-8 TaxID=3416081 RepID=UPI003CFA1DD3
MSRANKSAYEIIKARILSEEYAPNEALVESVLAEELGFSRNTIKQALLLLEGDKLVEMQKNRSATVKSLNKKEVIELYEIRERLEGLIAYFDAIDLTDEDINKLGKYIEEMETYISNNKLVEYSNTNIKFHKVLYDGCTNNEAVNLLSIINLQLRRYKKRTILITGRSDNSLNEHQKIFKALRNRNPEEAENAMREHIRNVKQTMIDHYDILY